MADPTLIHGNAVSHLDLANAGEPPVAMNPAIPATFDLSGLDKARAADKGGAAAPAVPAGPAKKEAQTTTEPVKTEKADALQWNRPSDKRRESQANYRKGLEQKIAELQAQLAQPPSDNTPTTNPPEGAGVQTPNLDKPKPAPSSTSSAPDITADERWKKLQAERDEYLDIVKQVAIERDPEFKARFDTAREAAVKSAKSLAGAAGDDIAKILSISDPETRTTQLAERIKDFSQASKDRIMAAASRLNAIEVERGIELDTRKQTYELRQQQMMASEQQDRARRENSLQRELDRAVARWRDPENGMPFTLGPNADAVMARANDILFGRNPQYSHADLAEDSIKAAVLPEVIRFAQAQAEQIAKYESFLQRYNISIPDDGGAVSAPVQSGQAQQPIGDVHSFMVQNSNNFASGLEAARQSDAARGWNR